jgi:predicted nuclease of predicted toxin-antitoxin system
VQTVFQERLIGTDDKHLFEICASEGRCLITLDLDFADILRFPPHTGAGVAVLRLSRTLSLSLLTELVQSLLTALERESIACSVSGAQDQTAADHGSRSGYAAGTRAVL